MPRLPDIDPATLTPEQKRIHDEIVSGPRGKVEGPLRVWLTSPGLADRAQALGAFCRYGTSLDQRLSELAILVTGAYWRAGFEWHVHAPIGVKAGLDPAAVEAIKTIAQRQGDMVRAAMEEFSRHGSDVMAAATVEEKAVKQIDFAKKSYETAIANSKELAGMVGKSQTEAFEALSARVAELTEEVKAAIAKK